MSKLKHEVAVVLGVLAGVAEIVVQTFPSGSLRDTIAVAIPILTAVGIRANVVPLEKIVGPVDTLLPVVVRLEQVIASVVKPKKVAAIVPPEKPAA